MRVGRGGGEGVMDLAVLFFHCQSQTKNATQHNQHFTEKEKEKEKMKERDT
jgi:hypothetical protein